MNISPDTLVECAYCNDTAPHFYSLPDYGYEGCPAHPVCVDPDCQYRRIHLDMIDEKNG